MCLGYYRYLAASRSEIVPRVQGTCTVDLHPFDIYVCGTSTSQVESRPKRISPIEIIYAAIIFTNDDRGVRTFCG